MISPEVVNADLCRAVAAWLTESVGTYEQPVIENGVETSWTGKIPRIDSHGIYEVKALESLPDGIRYDRVTDMLVTGDRMMKLGARTVAEVEEFESQAVVGPKGAEPFDDDVSKLDVVFSGYELSATLDRLLTGQDAGGQFYGRGTAHRARVAHLAEGGGKTLTREERIAARRAQ